MTHIIEAIESAFPDPLICQKIALLLCTGGNDFVPGFFGKSHSQWVKVFLKYQSIRDEFFEINEEGKFINSDFVI